MTSLHTCWSLACISTLIDNRSRGLTKNLASFCSDLLIFLCVKCFSLFWQIQKTSSWAKIIFKWCKIYFFLLEKAVLQLWCHWLSSYIIIIEPPPPVRFSSLFKDHPHPLHGKRTFWISPKKISSSRPFQERHAIACAHIYTCVKAFRIWQMHTIQIKLLMFLQLNCLCLIKICAYFQVSCLLIITLIIKLKLC